MSQNRYWNLVAKKLTGEAIPEELEELDQIIKDNPDLIKSSEHIENIFKLSKLKGHSYDTEMAFEHHLNKLREMGISFPDFDNPIYSIKLINQAVPFRKKRIVLYSLFGLVVLCIGGFIWQYNSRKAESLPLAKGFSEVSTRLGSKSTKLILPDSSVVWLNAGSKLSYDDKQYGVTHRNTVLIGEAYFDIKKNPIPFTIHANSVHIKVLGTAFNVKSYPNEKTTETSLIRGRVEITLDKRPGEKFILKPNEKLIVSNEMEEINPQLKQKKEPLVVLSGLTHFTNDNTIIETSWVENRLVFQDESFAEIVKKMERWFNVTIEIKDEKISQFHLTGTFENENIKQALSALQIVFPFNFTINQNNITITQ